MTDYAQGLQDLLHKMDATYLTLFLGVGVGYYGYRTLRRIFITWSKLFILSLSVVLSLVTLGLIWGFGSLLV